MQTLRKLFFKRYLKEWSLISVSGFLVTALIVMGHKHIPGLISFAGALYVIFGPIIHASFTNNDFQENLDWLINYQFNRKQLIKFYLSTQTIKLALVTMTYSVYFIVFAFTQKVIEESAKVSAQDKSLLTDFIEYSSSWAGISIVYFVFLIAIYAVYFASLFQANSEFIRRENIRKKTHKEKHSFIETALNIKEWKAVHYVMVLWILTLFFVFLGTEVEELHAIVIMSGIVGLFSVQIFNRKFKVFTINRAKTYSYMLCALLVTPHFAFYLGSISDVTNTSKNLNARISSLDYISPHYTTDYKVLSGMYKKAKTCKQFGWLSAYAGKKELEPKYFLPTNTNFCKFAKSVYFYNLKAKTNKYIPQLVIMAEKYIINNELEDIQQIKLAATLSTKKMKRRYINSLIETDSVFKKYLALNLARKSLGKRKYKTFVKAHYESLPESIRKLGSIKRAVASITEKKDRSKKKGSKSFNYDHY